MKEILKSVKIVAPVDVVWNALTKPDLMIPWMAEPEMAMEIVTTWNEGSTIVIRGFHHVKFENKGIVVKFEPNTFLEYTYMSSLSRLPDNPENYTHTSFRLTPLGNQTTLDLTLRNFPTEVIRKHIDFYWTSTLTLLKQLIEKN